MSLAPIRPRFTITIPGTVEEQIARIESAVADPQSRCVSRTLGNHVDITVVQDDRHRWSPCVQMEFVQSDDDTVVHGLVGPHPDMWTLFAFLNITLLLASGFGLMFGLAQLSAGMAAWGLWIAPVGVLLLGGMYALSQVGQRCAAEQTQLLRKLIENALGCELS